MTVVARDSWFVLSAYQDVIATTGALGDTVRLSIFQNDDSPDSDSTGEARKSNPSYKIWFILMAIASCAAIWSTAHYELLAKVAWTVIGPGFTLSQTQDERHDFLSRSLFLALLGIHFSIMQVVFPYLPGRQFVYVLFVAIVEIMTLGTAYQVWLRVRD